VPGKKVMPLSSQGPATAAPSRAGGIPDGTAVPAEQPGIEEPTREGKPSPSAMYAVGGIPPAAPRERKPRDAYARAGAKPTGKPRAATEDDLDDEIPY